MEFCVIDAEKCIGCMECVAVCPFSAMFFDPVSGEVVACDLCAGNPACVKFCSIGALTFLPIDTIGAGEKQYYRKLKEARESPVIKASVFAEALPFDKSK